MLPWACVAQAQGKRYYLPAGEILRFYFGALSLSAAAFMSLAANDEAAGLFDPEHTRFLEPDVLQIAPVSGLADRASALHLALLLHSPDLMKLWRSTVALFIAAGARGEPDFYPEIELPNTQHAFALLGRSEVIANSFEQGGERAFLVSSIASDYRTIPFKRLVIKLPSGLDEFELADLDEERLDASSRYQNILAPGLPLENRRRPGVRVTQMSPFHESLRIVLWHFYVDPTSRREGVGRRLIEVVKAHAVDCGARHIWLETSSLNVPGVNAYGALGFSLTGADLTLYDGTPSEGEIALFYSRGVRAQPPL
ncbi:MAG: hypothetical protein BroJett013_13190 [Alphaproteobacteria bacterium]|nr:MAG: hypothetical protein BroJett013_13190 [Alphaproteobacteria bacterium]